MKRLSAVLATALLAAATLAAAAQADPSQYGIEALSAATSTNLAGDHPDFTNFIELKTEGAGKNLLPGTTRDLTFTLPPGLLGNPTAAPTCSAGRLVGTDAEDPSNASGCAPDSQVGVTEITLRSNNTGGGDAFVVPIYNMEPRYGEPARFGFFAVLYPVFIDTELSPDHEYAAIAKIEGASSLIPLLSARTVLWGVPADESHDTLRLTTYESVHCNSKPCTAPGGSKRPSSLSPVPFMTNSTDCAVARELRVTATLYALPDLHVEAIAPLEPVFGCGLLELKPSLSIAPTTAQAESGSGLDVELSMPHEGFDHPNLPAESPLRRAEITLPEGLSINPSQAEGLGVCSAADFARESASSLPGEGCPQTSKIGSVTAKSPLLAEEASGALYVAKPYQNPFDSLIALYMVLKIPERGVIVRLAGKVTPDPKTGQLITTFGEAPYEIPQLPVSTFELHFREGARSPLITPPACGSYQSSAVFTSWAAKTVTLHPSFQITRGPGGGPCPPGGVAPFHPGFEAGSVNNNAGSYSPFDMRLTRKDGEQDMTKFSAVLPPGVVGRIAGLAKCPEAAIAASKARTGPHGGAEELSSPSCPAASKIGRTLAGAGVGSQLTYVPGSLYLAGPVAGDPLSVVSITPAVAGPFDAGTVVVREALTLNSATAEVEVDGSHSDPIPHILKGIPLNVRDLRVYADRPSFTINPTNCEPSAARATLFGSFLAPLDPSDDVPVGLFTRYQAANCASLGFKPNVQIRLRGGTKRGAFPALSAIVTPRPGDANFKAAVVTLPHSAFLEQGHFKTICTRVQFAAGGGNGAGCPAASIYGTARAQSPLLDETLEGPVYLRSSSHNLPDLVIALHGLVDVNLASRIDSHKGGIRSTFESIPDAPVSKFVLEMQGGKKGLIVNSTNLCSSVNRADARLRGQNGKLYEAKPALQAKCPKGKRHRTRAHRRRHRHAAR